MGRGDVRRSRAGRRVQGRPRPRRHQPGDADARRSGGQGAPRGVRRQAGRRRSGAARRHRRHQGDRRHGDDVRRRREDRRRRRSNVVLDAVQGVVARRAARPQPGRLLPRADRQPGNRGRGDAPPDRPGQAHQARARRSDGSRRRSMGPTVLDARRCHRRPLRHLLGCPRRCHRRDLRLGPRPRRRRRGRGHRQPGADRRARRRRVGWRPSGLDAHRRAGGPRRTRPVRVDDGRDSSSPPISAPRRTRWNSSAPASSAC